MKTDLKAELEWLSLAKLVAEFTRELSLQYLITVDLSDGGKDYTRSFIVPSGYRNLGSSDFIPSFHNLESTSFIGRIREV